MFKLLQLWGLEHKELLKTMTLSKCFSTLLCYLVSSKGLLHIVLLLCDSRQVTAGLQVLNHVVILLGDSRQVTLGLQKLLQVVLLLGAWVTSNILIMLPSPLAVS